MTETDTLKTEEKQQVETRERVETLDRVRKTRRDSRRMSDGS